MLASIELCDTGTIWNVDTALCEIGTNACVDAQIKYLVFLDNVDTWGINITTIKHYFVITGNGILPPSLEQVLETCQLTLYKLHTNMYSSSQLCSIDW